MLWSGDKLAGRLKSGEFDDEVKKFVRALGASSDEVMIKSLTDDDLDKLPHSYRPHLAAELIADVEIAVNQILGFRFSRHELERQLVIMLNSFQDAEDQGAALITFQDSMANAKLAPAFKPRPGAGDSQLKTAAIELMKPFASPVETGRSAAETYARALVEIGNKSREVQLAQLKQSDGPLNVVERSRRIAERSLLETRIAYRKALAAAAGLISHYGLTNEDFQKVAGPQHEWIGVEPPRPKDGSFIDRFVIWVTVAQTVLDTLASRTTTSEIIIPLCRPFDGNAPLLEKTKIAAELGIDKPGVVDFDVPDMIFSSLKNPRVQAVGVSFATADPFDSTDVSAKDTIAKLQRTTFQARVTPPKQKDAYQPNPYAAAVIGLTLGIAGDPVQMNSDLVIRDLNPIGAWKIAVATTPRSPVAVDDEARVSRAKISDLYLHLLVASEAEEKE